MLFPQVLTDLIQGSDVLGEFYIFTKPWVSILCTVI